MATKKKNKSEGVGVTLEIDGEVIGTFKSLEIKKLEEGEVSDFLPRQPIKCTGKEVTIAAPELIHNLLEGQEVNIPLGRQVSARPTHPEADLILKAQLEMWGMDEGEVPVSLECVVKLAQLMDELGYHWWVDSEASPDKKMAEAHSVVVEPVKFSYVSRGDRGNEG